MRILYHHRTQAEDAQGIHISEMVKAFQKLGHEVEIEALVKPSNISDRQNPKYFSKRLLQAIPQWLYEILSFVYNVYGYFKLLHAIKEKKPDLIYERYALNTFCGIWAAKRFDIPFVLEVNAPLWYEQSRLGKLRFKGLARFSERWICSRATWTLVVSNVLRNFLVGEKIPTDKLVVMPNGIDPTRFHPNIRGQLVRARYSLDGNQVIGFVGWFRRWHGLELLMELMHEANLGERNVRLLLVGDGPAEPELRRYANLYKLNFAVRFTGPIPQEEIPSHIAAMDIVVQPRATEYACPMKLIEYMAMQKCIVAPNQENIRELIENGVSGCLFKPDHKDSLHSTLLQLIQDPSKRECLAANAYRAIYERKLLWEANAKRTLELVFGKESCTRF